MGHLIKVLKLHWSYLPFLFIFREISKGVHTIVTICHQFGVLKAPVIQTFFIGTSSLTVITPIIPQISYHSILYAQGPNMLRNIFICLYTYICIYIWRLFIPSIFRKKKVCTFLNFQGLSIFCFNGNIRKREPIMQDSI